MVRTTTLNRLPTYQDRSHDPRSRLTPCPLHLPTACRSAICTQTLIVLSAQALRPSLQCSCTTTLSIQTQMQYALLLTHKNHMIKSSRTTGRKWTPGAEAMPQPGFIRFPVTKKNGSQQECHSYHDPLHHSGALRSAQPLLWAACWSEEEVTPPSKRR